MILPEPTPEADGAIAATSPIRPPVLKWGRFNTATIQPSFNRLCFRKRGILEPPKMIPEPVVPIEPEYGRHLFNRRELVNYRDLVYFLVLRDVTVLYKQTILGLSWAILNPFMNMIVFTVIFGSLLNLPSVYLPYALFSFAGLLPWTYFSYPLTIFTNSLI